MTRRRSEDAPGARRQAPRRGRKPSADEAPEGVLPQLGSSRAQPSPPTGMDPATRARTLAALQRLYGNAAVQRLVEGGQVPAVQRDSVTHDAHPTLTWKDFKGRAPKGAAFDAETLAQRSGLGIRWSATRSGGVWTADATLDASSLDLKASMNRGRSWVRKGKRSADLLRHEQGHFDIENVLVEKGEVAIKAVAAGVAGTGTGATQKKAADDAVADLQTTAPFQKLASLDGVLGTAQHDYDEDPTTGTDHGTKAVQQAQWEADIVANLPAYPIP